MKPLVRQNSNKLMLDIMVIDNKENKSCNLTVSEEPPALLSKSSGLNLTDLQYLQSNDDFSTRTKDKFVSVSYNLTINVDFI